MSTPKKQSVHFITESSKLGELIKSIGNRGKKLDADMHLAAMSALWFAYNDKNAAFAQQLIDAMNKAGRTNALKGWLMLRGPFLVKEGTKTLGMDKDKQQAGWSEAEQHAAFESPFWKSTAAEGEDAPDALDAMELVQKLLTRLTKAKRDGKLDAQGQSVLDKLSKVAPALEVNSGKKAEAPAK